MGLSTVTKIFRFIFGFINFIVLCCGIAVLGLGIYLQVESEKYNFITGNDHAGPAILIASGAVTLLVAGTGLLGAVLKQKFLLVIYAIALAVIIILEFATGILGFVYKDNAKDYFEENYSDRLYDAIKEYDTNKNARRALDYLQKEAKCCGVEEPSDWGMNGRYIFNNNGSLPESCNCEDIDDEKNCGTVEFEYEYDGRDEMYASENLIWTKGCYNDTAILIEKLAVVYGGVGLGFAIFEIAALVLAIGLVVCISKTHKEYEVV